MSSIRPVSQTRPVKLFVGCVPGKSIEERLISQRGPADHVSSLIPMEGSIHRVFISLEHLVETGSIPEIQGTLAGMDIGFVDNRRVVVTRTTGGANRFELGEHIYGEEVLVFRNHTVQFQPWTCTDYQSDACSDFFLTMRKLFRVQLRSMCLLKG